MIAEETDEEADRLCDHIVANADLEAHGVVRRDRGDHGCRRRAADLARLVDDVTKFGERVKPLLTDAAQPLASA